MRNVLLGRGIATKFSKILVLLFSYNKCRKNKKQKAFDIEVENLTHFLFFDILKKAVRKG